MRITRLLAITGLFLACASTAFAQLKPDMLVILDSSGSMIDGEIPGSTGNACGYGTTASQQRSKGAAALCAVQQMVSTNGDAYFGLMRFAGDSSSGNGRFECGNAATSGGLLLQALATNNAAAMSTTIRNIGTASLANYFVNATPTGGALQDARGYYEGTLGTASPTAQDSKAACRSLNVILITDGMEECIDCDDLDGTTGCPKARAQHPSIYCGPNANADGVVTNACYTGDNDGPYHLDTAQERAFELFTETTVPSPGGPLRKQVRTYVVAFGVDPTNAALTQSRQRIESIALAGGTDNPFDANLRAYYPQNAQELSAALAQIIADAQPPDETCNGMDDDCDTRIDEGVPTFCNLPGNHPTQDLCTSPGEQNCDGIDDDCDGVIDEGLLNECGVCGPVPDETCDGVDNDCDTRVDEGSASDEMCGTDEGICEAGTIVCIAGAESCQGALGPDNEECDCLDNDCDGVTDENPDGTLCGTGQCVGCNCVNYCLVTSEFGADCPQGRVPQFLDNGACVCITDTCDRTTCPEETQMRDGKVICAPDTEGVGACRCSGGTCVALCDGVTCGNDQVCDPRSGRCVVNDCRGLGCDEGELCDPVSGECEVDKCDSAECSANQVCRDGACEASCAGVTCRESQLCMSGKCVSNPCANVDCDGTEVCDPARGECVENQCLSNPCTGLTVCIPASGECEADPCIKVECPSNQRCVAGECYALSVPTGGNDGSGGTSGGTGKQIFATGGSGCTCQLTGAHNGRTPSGLWVGLGLLAVFGLRRARRQPGGTPAGLWLSMLGLWVLLAVVSGCKVTPFCVDCQEAEASGGASGTSGGVTGAGGATGGASNTGGDVGGSMPETGGSMDGGVPCVPQTETCNDQDDDCDFKVDEGVRATQNNCSQTGICAGTRPTCIAGEFTCRFGDGYEMDEVTCDGIDNDCDGRIDEAFTALGTACSLGNGECKESGKFVCAATGLALRCDATPGTPGEEICDNLDNDCDGLIDEPKSDPGSADSYVVDDMVQVSASLWIYQYEASRPDARAAVSGSLATRACSREGVLPWVNVTYSEAAAACQAAGLQLCTAAAWQDACNGGDDTCRWSYTPSGGSACATTPNAYPTTSGDAAAGMACNGHDVTATSGPIGAGSSNDELRATGAMANCFTPAGTALPDGPVYDLSGNAKEWVNDPAQSGSVRALRGGSYNDLADAMQCSAGLSAANASIRLPTVGFRCCSNSAP